MVQSEKKEQIDRPGLVLTAVGPDRPGLVRELSRYVNARGGNIEDTRMSKLGGEFAFLVLITGTVAVLEAVQNALSELAEATGLQVHARRTQAGFPASDARTYHLEVSGFDRTGIVEHVSGVLVSRGVNVTSLQSRVEHAPLSGTPLFLLDAEIELPSDLDALAFEKELFEACGRENLEFILNRN